MPDLPDLLQRALIWLIGLLALAAILTSTVNAAPRAKSAEECFYVADAVLTARALIIERADEAMVRRVLAQMYNAPLIAVWLPVVLSLAQRDQRPAAQLAQAFMDHCSANGGNVDQFVGTAI
jgi:hypothetical protein